MNVLFQLRDSQGQHVARIRSPLAALPLTAILVVGSSAQLAAQPRHFTQPGPSFNSDQANGCVAPPAGLVSWWPGDNNENDIVDGNNPSVVEAVSLVPGEVKNAFSFGTRGYIEIPAAANLENQQFTWAAWVRPDGPGPNNDRYGSVIVIQNIDALHNSVGLHWRATDDRFTFDFGDVNSEIIASTDAFPTGTFYLVAATYDGSTFRLFVNGKPEGSFAEKKTVAYSSSGWTFGSGPPSFFSTSVRTWNGVIDEIQAFNRALSESELQSIFNAGSTGECKQATASTVTSVLPQLAFGGGWATSLYFTNLTASAVSFPVNFVAGDGSPLNVPALNGSLVQVNLAERGSVVIEAPDSNSLVEGYATAALPAGVTGYGVFRYTAPGSAAGQEAVVPLSGVTATTSTMIFDETSYTTGVAVVGLGSSAITVNVTAHDEQGDTLGTGSIQLASNGKTAVLLKDIPGLSGVVGKLGSVDFSVSSGNVAVLGIRTDGLAFTSIPTADR